MSKKKASKKVILGYEEELEPIIYDKKLSPSDLKHYIDISNIKLVLNDYDWCQYTLFAEMTTKEYGELKIRFEYCGAVSSDMEVETEKRIHSFQFDTDLFEEYIIRILRKNMRDLCEEYIFDGTEDVVDFYNAVLTSAKTRYEGSKINKRH